jgi:hypothetical protein
MILRLTASLAVSFAALLAAAPACAADAPAQAVTVSTCEATGPRNAQNWLNVFGVNVSQPATPAMLMIDFQNASNKPIATVEFGYVRNGRIVAMVRDTGTFAPNAAITHGYGLSDTAGEIAMGGTCVPLRVQYADGSTWMNSAMPAH